MQFLQILPNTSERRSKAPEQASRRYEKTARICNLLVLSGFELQKWWSWWLCSGTPIAPQNSVFLSIPRSRLARYDTSSAAFRLLIYGEKVGKNRFTGKKWGTSESLQTGNQSASLSV